MSIKVISWVWESSLAKGIDRLVLLAIADAASHDDGSNAYPSVATLAKKAGVAQRTVQRSIRTLCEIGELLMEQNAGRGGANMYQVVMRQVDTPDLESPRPVGTRHRVTTPGRESRRGVNDDTSPRPDDTRTVLEPLLTEREPSPYCSKHPNGTEGPCSPCGTARLRNAAWGKSMATRAASAKATALQARKDCPRCDGDGFILDADAKPIERCDHVAGEGRIK